MVACIVADVSILFQNNLIVFPGAYEVVHLIVGLLKLTVFRLHMIIALISNYVAANVHKIFKDVFFKKYTDWRS